MFELRQALPCDGRVRKGQFLNPREDMYDPFILKVLQQTHSVPENICESLEKIFSERETQGNEINGRGHKAV